jgi:ribonuclease HII
MPDFLFERRHGGTIAGIDEAGRGPWAGPVVAAAVILDAETLTSELCDGLDDSKVLSRAYREKLFGLLAPCASIGIGVAGVEEIDRVNILQASLLAMARAVAGLGVVPDHALVDGNQPPTLACPVSCIVRGDSKSLSIAAASIVAKVSRDRLMGGLAPAFPEYGWERNAGYGTAEHKAALERFGVTEHHRKSFAPIRKILSPPSD